MSVLTKKLKKQQIQKNAIKGFIFFASLLAFLFMVHMVTYAAVDPLESTNKLKTYLGKLVEGVGIIVVIVGIVVLGSALISHDPSQKITGILVIVAGILIAGATAVATAVL